MLWTPVAAREIERHDNNEKLDEYQSGSHTDYNCLVLLHGVGQRLVTTLLDNKKKQYV